RAALQQLVAQNPAAAKCKSKAVAVLVFPDVVKAGFIFGAQGGQGILFVHGQRRGRYRTVAASYGLQAGVQKYGYALFLMNQSAGCILTGLPQVQNVLNSLLIFHTTKTQPTNSR